MAGIGGILGFDETRHSTKVRNDDHSRNIDESVAIGSGNNSHNTTVINIGNTDSGNVMGNDIASNNQRGGLNGIIGIGLALLGGILGGQSQNNTNDLFAFDELGSYLA